VIEAPGEQPAQQCAQRGAGADRKDGSNCRVQARDFAACRRCILNGWRWDAGGCVRPRGNAGCARPQRRRWLPCETAALVQIRAMHLVPVVARRSVPALEPEAARAPAPQTVSPQCALGRWRLAWQPVPRDSQRCSRQRRSPVARPRKAPARSRPRPTSQGRRR
jgi:hypothetical protein